MRYIRFLDPVLEISYVDSTRAKKLQVTYFQSVYGSNLGEYQVLIQVLARVVVSQKTIDRVFSCRSPHDGDSQKIKIMMVPV
jgi:hypothetical protein